MSKLAEDVIKFESDALDEKKDQLAELEARLDKKILETKKVDGKLDTGGAISKSGAQLRQDPEEDSKKEAMKLLEGTGLNPFVNIPYGIFKPFI